MDTLAIIEKYYKKDSDLYSILVTHSQDVMNKAISIAINHPELGVDLEFIGEAAMLHDIGIYLTNAPDIKCYGIMPYLCHGYLGREILEKEGLIKHALICERHAGIGLSMEDIKTLSLPLPLRDMLPETVEEEIICFADCFFSKTHLGIEKTVDQVKKEVAKYATQPGLDKLNSWCQRFL